MHEKYRIITAFDASSKHNLKFFSKLMYQTHKRLGKDYEVSCKDLCNRN